MSSDSPRVHLKTSEELVDSARQAVCIALNSMESAEYIFAASLLREAAFDLYTAVARQEKESNEQTR